MLDPTHPWLQISRPFHQAALLILLTGCASLAPTIKPAATATATPAITPSPLSPCPQAGKPEFPDAPSAMSIAWMKQTINDYLNQGGDPENLPIKFTGPAFNNPQVKMKRVDVNNDGIDELVFSSGVIRTEKDTSGVDSGLWIFQCKVGKYVVAHQVEFLDEYSGNPRLVAAKDLNNDNRIEIVIQHSWHGSGCLEQFQIVSWERNNPSPTTRFFDDEHFPCDTLFSVGTPDANGNLQVLFKGKTDIRYDSVGGKQRRFVDTYILTGKTYTLKSHEYLPSPYRVYAIYDAQQALDQGNIVQAIQHYEQAAHNDKLDDFDSFPFRPNWYVEKWPENLSKQDHPREYVSSFSLFRLVVLYLYTHQEEKATLALEDLKTNYPAGKPGTEFTEAAQLFTEQYQAHQKNIPLACSAISTMIKSKHPTLDWHFEWTTWAPFRYSNQDFCPNEIVKE